jgi:hypothetical protein
LICKGLLQLALFAIFRTTNMCIFFKKKAPIFSRDEGAAESEAALEIRGIG